MRNATPSSRNWCWNKKIKNPMPHSGKKIEKQETKNIAEDIFRKILRPLDINFYKPNGGLWSSEFISRIYCISEWHDYLLYEDQETASYKNINAGAIFTLKNNAKILNIDSEEKIIELSQKYPSWHYILTHYDNPELNIIDFETLSN